MVKNPPANAEDMENLGSIPGLGRSLGEGNGSPLQYSCWKIPGTEEPDGLQSMGGSQKVRHHLETKTTTRLEKENRNTFTSKCKFLKPVC